MKRWIFLSLFLFTLEIFIFLYIRLIFVYLQKNIMNIKMKNSPTNLWLFIVKSESFVNPYDKIVHSTVVDKINKHGLNINNLLQ